MQVVCVFLTVYRKHDQTSKYDDAVNELHSLAELSAFQYGFSLGIRMMTESVSIDLTENE